MGSWKRNTTRWTCPCKGYRSAHEVLVPYFPPFLFGKIVIQFFISWPDQLTSAFSDCSLLNFESNFEHWRFNSRSIVILWNVRIWGFPQYRNGAKSHQCQFIMLNIYRLAFHKLPENLSLIHNIQRSFDHLNARQLYNRMRALVAINAFARLMLLKICFYLLIHARPKWNGHILQYLHVIHNGRKRRWTKSAKLSILNFWVFTCLMNIRNWSSWSTGDALFRVLHDRSIGVSGHFQPTRAIF